MKIVESTKPESPMFVPFVDRLKEAIERERAERAGGPRIDQVDRDLIERDRWRRDAFPRLKQGRGRRYAECSFANYQVVHPGQQEAVEKLKAYARDERSITEGKNIILYGPKGAGKDHLLMAMARQVHDDLGYCPQWENGCDLHDRLRKQSLDGGRSWCMDERTDDRKTDILWVSDPLPPAGNALSDFSQAALFALIDARYSDMKATWLTLNVAGPEEAEQRLGAQVVDRLRHDALVIHCNWPSYRTMRSTSSDKGQA